METDSLLEGEGRTMNVVGSGIGAVFGNLPFSHKSGSHEPTEKFIVVTIKAILSLTTVMSVLVVLLYHLIPTTNGSRVGVNKTDAYAPIGLQTLLILWLLINKGMLSRLEQKWNHINGVVSNSSVCGEDALGLLSELQSEQITDLETRLDPAILEPHSSEVFHTGTQIVQKLLRGPFQPSQRTPTFRGLPSQCTNSSYRKCLIIGACTAGGQVVLLRLLFNEVTESQGITDTARACYWCATVQLCLSLFLFYSLLALIVFAYHQQYLIMKRFTCMLIKQRAAKHRLPYFVLHTKQNMQVWYVVRSFLLAHVIEPNALSEVMDPTFAMCCVAVVACSCILIVRHLFESLAIDFFASGCFSLIAAGTLFIVCVTVYGFKIQGHVTGHVEILAHIQWEITRRWNSTLEILEDSPPDARTTAMAEKARNLWILRRYTHSLMDTCERDNRGPRILKASFNNLRWWFMIGLLILNTVLFFAVKRTSSTIVEPTAQPTPVPP
eukprot:TRINITY_DN175_c0_g4_i2.p1 TRINITY_DN175_c0_g4~~TRINITY_DN175_c0_g4_i2.p1  ORF type:complete len:495 (+),score=34.62 TRINITY_DN175_c0_g4_i2:101-1585(+)